MKSGWITHKGKRIFVARYDHLTVAESRIEVAEVEKEIFKQPPNSALMEVTTTGTILAPEALGIYKNTSMACKPYLKKTVVMGMSGPRMPIFISFYIFPDDRPFFIAGACALPWTKIIRHLISFSPDKNQLAGPFVDLWDFPL